MPINEPLSEDAVNTQEQRNQAWTRDNEGDPRRDQPTEHQAGDPPPPLDRPDELEQRLDDVVSNPSSDAQDTSDTQGGAGELGGVPKTGDLDNDPMRQAQGGQSGG
ncbi:MAG TPA: hypothetical protein VNT56_00930 [Acidimicrobiales bacterium]|jgi:hypothetical protein|nr:hypothetical protein [Acidimicrobiales bacterium]